MKFVLVLVDIFSTEDGTEQLASKDDILAVCEPAGIPLGPGGVAVENNGARFELTPDEYRELTTDETLAEEWLKTEHPEMSDFQMLCDEAELAGMKFIDVRKNNIRVDKLTDIYFLPKKKVFKVVRVKPSGRVEKLFVTELPLNAVRAATLWTNQIRENEIAKKN